MRGGYDDPAMGAREGSGDFGGQLRRYREAAGLSQEELAERAALTAKAISALETGERQHPYPQTVRALADALNLSDADRSALIAAVPTRARSERGDPATAAALSVSTRASVGADTAARSSRRVEDHPGTASGARGAASDATRARRRGEDPTRDRHGSRA